MLKKILGLINSFIRSTASTTMFPNTIKIVTKELTKEEKKKVIK